MTQAIPGYNAAVQVTTLAGSTSGFTGINELTDVSLNAVHETFDVTNHDGSGERERIGGLGDFSLDLSGRFVDDDRSQLQIFDALVARRALDMEHHPTGLVNAGDFWTGKVFPTKWELSGSVNQPANINMALAGSGPLTLIRTPLVANLTTVQGDFTSIVVPVPSGAVVGDLLMVFGVTDDSFAGLVPPAGWLTEALDLSGGNVLDSYVGSRVVDGTEPADYTWITGAASEGQVFAMFLIQNVASPFLDVSPLVVNGLGITDPVAPSVTTVTRNTLVFRVTMVQADPDTTIPFALTGLTDHVELEETDAVALKVSSIGQQQIGPTGTFTFDPADPLPGPSNSYTVVIRGT